MCNIRKNIRFIITVLLILWLVFIVFHVILTGKIYLWNFFGSLPTFIFLLIPLIFLAYEVFQRERRFINIFIAVFSLILGFTQTEINLFRMKVENQSKQYTEIKVFNWNTNLWDQSKDKDRYYKFLKEQKADMYILQEYLHLSINPAEYSLGNIDQSRSFRACSVIPGFPPIYRAIDDTERIAKEFPGYYIHTNLQFVLISRFPIIESHADYSEQYAVFDVDIHGRLVRFFNIHMLLHIEPGNPFAPYFYQALNRRFQARRLGFRDLKENIRKTESAYLIAGDFNSTNAMGVMNDLLKNHIDAIKYSNDLIPLSFEYKGLRLWRFDYALVSKTNNNLKIKFSKIINNEGLSDHNPLYLILDIKPINK